MRRSATATAVSLGNSVACGLHTLSKLMEDRALPRETRVDRLKWLPYYSPTQTHHPQLAWPKANPEQ
jgi:hypothetical protein